MPEQLDNYAQEAVELAARVGDPGGGGYVTLKEWGAGQEGRAYSGNISG